MPCTQGEFYIQVADDDIFSQDLSTGQYKCLSTNKHMHKGMLLVAAVEDPEGRPT